MEIFVLALSGWCLLYTLEGEAPAILFLPALVVFLLSLSVVCSQLTLP